MFMSEIYGNCIFSMSDTLINFAILKYTGIADTNEAMVKLLHDTKEITEWFGHFIGRFLLVFAEEHLGLQSKKVEIPEPPNIDKVTLPRLNPVTIYWASHEWWPDPRKLYQYYQIRGYLIMALT